MVDPERDGFFVELTFVKRLGHGGGKKGKCGNPGKTAWEKMAKKKGCVVHIQNKDDLYCATAIVTMNEKKDKGSHYQELRCARPIQERGFKELQKFQDYLGPQGYQLIMVEPSKCLIVFKDSQYNRAPHCIGLVKHQ